MVIGRWRTGYYKQNKCAIIFPSTNERPTGVHNKEELFHGEKEKIKRPEAKAFSGITVETKIFAADVTAFCSLDHPF